MGDGEQDAEEHRQPVALQVVGDDQADRMRLGRAWVDMASDIYASSNWKPVPLARLG